MLLMKDLDATREGLDKASAEVIEKYDFDEDGELVYTSSSYGSRCCNCEHYCCKRGRTSCINMSFDF